jgi:hypothetical protein
VDESEQLRMVEKTVCDGGVGDKGEGVGWRVS